MLIASSVAILVATFPKKERGLAMGLISVLPELDLHPDH